MIFLVSKIFPSKNYLWGTSSSTINKNWRVMHICAAYLRFGSK